MNDTVDAPPYGRILRLEELLEAACVREDDVERVLFLATHQSCEIFFAVVLRHLEDVREALDAGDGFLAARRAAPCPSSSAPSWGSSTGWPRSPRRPSR
ncbi:hypothetical protein ACU4GG_42945 [Streptomyces nojiriensis]